MYAKTLSDYVRTYLDRQAFLDECRADGRPTDAASEAVARASRGIIDMLDRSRPSAPPEMSAVAEATRRYLDAEYAFEQASAGGNEVDVPARRMERARRDLERRLESPGDDRIVTVKVRRVPRDTTRPPRRRQILVAYDESGPARHALRVAV